MIKLGETAITDYFDTYTVVRETPDGPVEIACPDGLAQAGAEQEANGGDIYLRQCYMGEAKMVELVHD